jgi:hypothetical protein
MSGSSIRGIQYGSYGELGIPSESNVPPSRYDALACLDVHGILWLFGGSYSDATSKICHYTTMNNLTRSNE